MLQSIRDRSQGWLTWFLVIIICISFALFGIHTYLQSSNTEQVIAVVDGTKITKQQLNTAYDRLRQQLQSQAPAGFLMTPILQKQLKSEALEQLIHTEILSKAAQRSGYRVSNGQLYAVITQIPAFQIEGKFSTERFETVLRQIAYSSDAFIKSLQSEIVINQVQAGFFSSAFSLTNELDDLQKLLAQRREITYATIPAASFKNSVKISEQQLQDYYNAHKAEYMLPEQLSFSYIELKLSKLIAEQKVSEAEIKQYYQDNAASFTTPARYHLAYILLKPTQNAAEQTVEAKLNLIQNKLKQHENFATLAETLSEDIVSAKHGGDLGWVHLADLEPAVQTAIENLAVAGVTKPIQTKYGFEIFKLMAIEPAKLKPLEQLKTNIKQRLAQQKAQAQFRQLSDKLANLSFSNPNSLKSVAEQLGLPIQQSELFSRQGGTSSLTSNPNVIAAAFSKDVLEEANNSDIIEIAPGDVLVLRVKEFKQAQLKSLDSMKSAIKEQLLKQSIQEEVKNFSAQLVLDLKNGKSTAELAKNYAFLNWHEVKDLTRRSKSPEAAIIRLAFNLAPPLTVKQPTVQSGLLANGDGVVLILHKVTHAQPANLSQQEYQGIASQLAGSYAELAYQEYAAYLLKQAKLKQYATNGDSE